MVIYPVPPTDLVLSNSCPSLPIMDNVIPKEKKNYYA